MLYKSDYDCFSKELDALKMRRPLSGQLELTWRCTHRCIHCYCKAMPKKELGASFWKDLIRQIHKAGGLELTLTGGDPLLHEDFRTIYAFAKKKGFLISLFTTGYHLDRAMLDFLAESPPLLIEITLNSLKKKTYEAITKTHGTFDRILANILEAKKRRLPLVIKCNGLKENKNEILKIKKFSEHLLGKKKFKFDSFIYPSLDGRRYPLSHRLSANEIRAIEEKDKDMRGQLKKSLAHQRPRFNPDGLYHCNNWHTRYYVNPQGFLQFCHLTTKYSTDLRKESFARGFLRFPDILKEKYKTESRCIRCKYAPHCLHCPARAYLETGSTEAPVTYYCELAKKDIGHLNHFV